MDFNSIYEDALNFGNNLRDCYKNGDKNKDGYLSKQELKAALQDFTGEMITKCEMDELLDDMDPNGDGKITYEEFISGSINLGKQTEKQNMFIKTEFHKTANSEDGYVKKKVISKIFKETVQDKMSKKQINYFMDRIDQDGNGWIDYNEFVDFFFELAKTAANDAIQPPKDKTKDKRKSFFRIRWFLLWIGPFGNGKIGIINHDISLKYIFKNIQLDPHEFCLLDDYVVR